MVGRLKRVNKAACRAHVHCAPSHTAPRQLPSTFAAHGSGVNCGVKCDMNKIDVKCPGVNATFGANSGPRPGAHLASQLRGKGCADDRTPAAPSASSLCIGTGINRVAARRDRERFFPTVMCAPVSAQQWPGAQHGCWRVLCVPVAWRARACECGMARSSMRA